MINKKIYLIIFSIGLIGCINDNPIEFEDNNLGENIIGSWTDAHRYSIIFFKDGSFQDTTLFFSYSPTSNISDTTIVVNNGKYTIENSILLISNFDFEYVKFGGGTVAVSFYSHEYKIDISDGILKRKRATSFVNLEQSSYELWGVWKSEGWVSGYSSSTTELHGSGTYNLIYTFIEDSLKFNRVSESSISELNMENKKYSYDYKLPYLSIPDYAAKMFVEFRNNKMFWIYDSKINDLVKVK